MTIPPPGGGPVMRADRLGKKFKIYPTPWARAREWLSPARRAYHADFWAVRDVSFSLARGESLGVIGVNGSGKSTLLKVLSGALYPTEGTFAATGRVLSLLELGTGVNPLLTGRQNVVTSSRLLDFPPGYAEGRMASIEAFADLPAGFFDRPVGVYSSGMLVRLVFSMFACFDPDVFIVDEALSVGDVFFQQKCARRLQEMRAGGTTMLFVSHDLAAVEALCDRVMVLHAGTVRHCGDKLTGIRMYYALSGAMDPRRAADDGADVGAHGRVPATDETVSGRSGVPSPTVGGVAGLPGDDNVTPMSPPPSPAGVAGTRPYAPTWHPPDSRGGDHGDGRVRVTGVAFRRDDGADAPVVGQAEWLDVYVRLEAAADVGPVNVGVAVFDRFDRLLFARGWVNGGPDPLWLSAGQRVVARFRVNLDLEPGEYSLTLSAAEPLRDADGRWDQAGGGAVYAEVKRAAKVAVLPRADGARTHYGPAPLRSEMSAEVLPTTQDDPRTPPSPTAGVAATAEAAS